MKSKRFTYTTAMLGAALISSAALAGSHTWDIVEAFSTADGSVQFIELREMNGGNFETFLAGKKVTSESTGNEYTFPANLVGPTGNKRILLATQSFADLPNAPVPDHIIPANFFNQNGDTLRYHVYDTWVIAAGTVPTNCVDSLNDNGTTGPATPTNYAGNSNTGPIDACPAPPCNADITGDDSAVDVFDLLTVLENFGTNGTGAAVAPPLDSVDVFDLLGVLDAWGDCPR